MSVGLRVVRGLLLDRLTRSSRHDIERVPTCRPGSPRPCAPIAAGETTARSEVVEAALARIAAADRAAQRVLRGAGRRGARRGRPARPRAGRGRGSRARCTAYRSRSRRRSTSPACVTTFGGRGNSHARPPPTPRSSAGCGRRARSIVGKTTMPEFGAFPYTESVARGITRNPWDRDPHPRRLQRRYGGRGGRRDGAGRHRAATAAARSGSRAPAAGCSGSSRSAAGSPPRPQPHLWWALGTAGPLTRSVLDSALVYDVIRGNVDGDLYRAGPSRVVRRGRRPRARAGCGSAGRRSRSTRGVRPDPVHVAARRTTPPGCSPTSATTSARSTRATPTRRWRSCRSSSPASAPRPTRSSTTTGSSGGPAQTYRLGAWVTPAGPRLGAARRPRRCRRRPTGSSTTSTCC